MAFSKRAVEIWRDFVASLSPITGAYQPDKAEIRAWGTEIEAQLDALATATGAGALNSPNPSFLAVDERGNQLINVDAAGFHLPGAIASYSNRAGHQVVDERGFVLHSVSTDRFNRQDIREHNARAMAHSVAARAPINNDTAGLIWNLTHIIGWGQSLTAGQECWPALTRTPRSVLSESVGSDALMIGQSIRSSNQYENAFNPVGDSNLRPLIATVQANNGGAVLTDAQVAALPAGDPSNGETPVEGAIFFLLRLLDLYAPQSLYRLLGTNVAVGGQNIANLRNTYFGRVTGAVTAGKAAADAQNWSYGAAAVVWGQGEQDYADGTTHATYKAALKSMYADTFAAMTTTAGQTDAPLWVMNQTSAPFVVDATGFSVGMAQWDLTKEDPRFAIATATYPFPDKTLHLDPNGSRWMGLYAGKVLFHQLVLRRRWRPLEPIEALSRGRQILVLFSVPAPPLQFRAVFEQNGLIDHIGRGFTVTDYAGIRVPIAVAELAGEATVLLTLDREAVGPLRLWYGRRDDGYGGGNLCDEDKMTAPFPYAYTAGSGQYDSANISTLVGKPYQLFNWSICFNIPVVSG